MDGYDWAALLTGPKVVRIFMGRGPLEQERRGGSLLQLHVAITDRLSNYPWQHDDTGAELESSRGGCGTS